MRYRNNVLALRLYLVFKQCSRCRERQRCYAHARPRRQHAIISRSHRVAGDLHPPCVYRLTFFAVTLSYFVPSTLTAPHSPRDLSWFSAVWRRLPGDTVSVISEADVYKGKLNVTEKNAQTTTTRQAQTTKRNYTTSCFRRPLRHSAKKQDAMGVIIYSSWDKTQLAIYDSFLLTRYL